MSVNQQTLEDESHMRTLSVLHFVLGGFSLLGMAFLLIHFAIMAAIFTMAPVKTSSSPTVVSYSTTPEIEVVEVTPEFPETTDNQEVTEAPITTPSPPVPVTQPAEMPKELMWILVAVYAFFGIFILAFCICNVLSGMWIKKRKNRTFSFVVAAMNCLQFPFGTALGVFTFIVLARPTVKSSYDVSSQV
ncbi:MAG: hypothetical protein NWT08_02250 [Akkermansiaceae bacterium]|jgi:hypothetical protein|nr:hypothetical protein [Akkermansiaceae bacterium]MDP4647488.1 hypothetical protein [Akkermansiaceae bacterium]MDP4779269.1 hypothetical protein [Akkermansiaceae bacterium]MDP4845980.1 hypothetical protein [Akkermansiaceae bacterium]MDP4899062.1 hypothetical protein [Akkermansiaceae bacterium]